ncbi:hypothetical protein Esti_001262 [Eimeria stiedai]
MRSVEEDGGVGSLGAATAAAASRAAAPRAAAASVAAAVAAAVISLPLLLLPPPRREGPLIRGWTKLPVAACRLETVASGAAPPVGPFPALLTLNSRGQVQAFEPVVIVNLCPMEGSSGDALYHVACKEVKEFDPRHMLSRPTPDLTFRLSLEENTISGILPSLVASSLKTFLARKEFRGTNPIVPMLKWLTERRKNKEDYSISCHDNRFRQKNPQLSYTSFWGELLQATYEYRGTDESALPSLSST